VNSSLTTNCRRCQTLAQALPANDSYGSPTSEHPEQPQLKGGQARGRGATALVLGMALSAGPWVIADVTGRYAAKLTAMMFLFGSPMMVFGLANLLVPLDTTTKSGERVLGVLAFVAFGLAGLLTFCFGRYVGLW